MPSPAPARILETVVSNPLPAGVDLNDPNGAKQLVGGGLFLRDDSPQFEWTQVLDPSNEFENPVVGLSGWAILPDGEGISDKDLPFSHPFIPDNPLQSGHGFDWEFYIAPDAPYFSLLAHSNIAGLDHDYNDAKKAATAMGLTVPGVLGVETDQLLVPANFRAQPGDRVAVFGRWIVDDGHDDYHTEIHPPLMVVCARRDSTNPDDITVSTLIGRPYLVSQHYTVDGLTLRKHLINEATKIETARSTRVEAHPKVMPTPFAGQIAINYLVRPPSPRQSPGDKLFVDYHFTVRTGVTVQVSNAGSDTVEVTVILNDAAAFDGWQDMPGGVTTNVALAAAGRKDNLFVFARTLDGRILFNQAAPGGAFVGWQEVPGGVITDAPLAAGMQADTLFVFAKRPDGTIVFNQAAPGGAFVGWQDMPGRWLDMPGRCLSCGTQSTRGGVTIALPEISQVRVWLLDGAKVASDIGLPPPAPGWSVIGVGNFDGDGKADLLWRRSDNTGEPHVWLLDGAKVASDISLPPPAPGWSVIGVGDFNGDGKADLLWGIILVTVS